MDHAIAKMTKQQEEEAATEHVIDKDNVTAVENISRPAPAVVADDQPQVSKPKGNADAKVSSPPAKGEFKQLLMLLRQKLMPNAHTSVMYVEPESLACTC